MNDRHIAHQVVTLLDEGTQTLDDRITARLRAARQKALKVQRTSEARLSLAGVGGLVRHEVSQLFRGWALLVALIVLAAGAHYWGQTQREAEIEELDSALLADDLPINAYLDRGFQTWLKDSSHE